MTIANTTANQSKGITHKFTVSVIIPYLKFFLLPVLASVYPTLFFYGNNVHELTLTDLWQTAIVYVSIAIVTYLAFLIKYRKSPARAANSTFIFLVFFNLYGLIENLLIQLDWFPVHDFITVPLTFLLASYSIWLINKLKDQIATSVWDYLMLVVGALIIYNLAVIAPVEVSKLQKPKPILTENLQAFKIDHQGNPDIYYIILDEFSGLEPMRKYWNNPKVDEFSKYLTDRGFIVFDDPHGSSTNTIYELASRLNYHRYPDAENMEVKSYLFDARADNRAMKFLKRKGYTTVTFDGIHSAYSSAPRINADISYNYEDMPASNLGVLFDDFGVMVADNTLLKVLSPYYKSIGTNQHSNFIFYTANHIGDLDEVASPKFVFVHLLIPHAPFMFDATGKINHPDQYTDYNYYLGNYNFSLYLTEKMVSNILSSADPSNPPVIILQSDHGLRNFPKGYTGQLENFPEEYKTSILYALLIPGHESSYSAQEMDPINTFPVLFNYLFDANIPLQ